MVSVVVTLQFPYSKLDYGTNDVTVTYIRDAFIKKEHAVSIYFDLEKAYDATWKHVIMKDIRELGPKGHTPHVISELFLDRRFKVWAGFYPR